MVGEACRSLVVCPAFPLPLARVGMPAIGRPSGGVDCDIQALQRRGNAYIGGGKRGGGLWCPFPPPWNHRRRGSWGVGQQQWCAAAFGWPAACIYRTNRSRVPSRQDTPPPTGSVNVGVARARLFFFTRAAAAAVAFDHERHDARWATRGGGGDPRGAAAASHACTRVSVGISKGGLGGRRKMGGRGGEAGVGRADGSPRATGYTLVSPTPEVTRSGGGGLSRPPHPPLTSGSSFLFVFLLMPLLHSADSV